MAQRPVVDRWPHVAPSWTRNSRLVAWRRRSKVADVTVDVVAGFQRHRSGRNAALVSHYGFLSVFPLMLVLTTILGFVLQDNEDLRNDILDSAIGNLPIVGKQITDDPASLRGSTVVLITGLLAAMWAGMKAFVAVQAAFDDIHEIELPDRISYVRTRVRALAAIAVIGGAQVVTAFITSMVGIANFGLVGELALVAAAIGINAIVLGATYRWLCSVTDPWRVVLPGAIAGGVVFAMLQLVGTTIVSKAAADASPAYGTFALFVGLLTWLTLHSLVGVVGAELNMVLAERSTRRAQHSPG
jgi:membrane protein